MEESNHQEQQEELLKLRLMVPQLNLVTEEYKRSERKLKALYQISELSSQKQKLDELYPAVHQIVSTLLNADNFYIGLVDRQKDMFEFAYFVDPYDSYHGKVIPYEQIRKGLTDYVLRQGKSLLAKPEDIERLCEAGELEIYGRLPVDWLGAPLIRDGEIIGVIAVQSYKEEVRYTEQDKELLNFVAEHIVSAMARVEQRHLLETIIEQRTHELALTADDLRSEVEKRKEAQDFQAALLEISELANQEIEIGDFYQRIHELLSQFINTDNYYIALIDSIQQELTFPYYANQFGATLTARKLANGLTELVLDKRDTLLLSRNEIESLVADKVVKAEQFKTNDSAHALSWLGCPLKVAGEVIGVISVHSYTPDLIYQEEHVRLLKFASHHIALAISHKLAADNLLMHQSKLENKIEQRTQALKSANNLLQQQIDERKKIEEQLFYDAHHDALTGLPNRQMLQNAIKRAVAHKRRDSSASYALLFVDLDRFKLINDTMGHHAGDEFLVEVSERINTCVREHDLLARLGGDEFVILLTGFEVEEDCEDVASRIIESVSTPYVIDNQNVYSGASIGIAVIHQHYQDETEVLRDADAAMYQAKNLGRGRYALFDPEMHLELVAEMELERQLRLAVEQDQLEIYFKPVNHLPTQTVIGFESSMKWNHPTRGLLEPESFISAAEDIGLIIKLDKKLIDCACQLLKQWQYESGEQKKYTLYVNISGMHFSQTRFVEDLIKLIKDSGIVPFHLVLGIDERALSRYPEDAIGGLKLLKKAGVKLALDNFGSDLASLNYLYNYPFDYIKIDRRFIKNMHSSNKHFMLVMSAQSVANHVGFKLIAKGIESAKQVQQLTELHCEYGQGSYLGKAKRLIRLSEADALTKRV